PADVEAHRTRGRAFGTARRVGHRYRAGERGVGRGRVRAVQRRRRRARADLDGVGAAAAAVDRAGGGAVGGGNGVAAGLIGTEAHRARAAARAARDRRQRAGVWGDGRAGGAADRETYGAFGGALRAARGVRNRDGAKERAVRRGRVRAVEGRRGGAGGDRQREGTGTRIDRNVLSAWPMADEDATGIVRGDGVSSGFAWSESHRAAALVSRGGDGHENASS